MTAAATAVKEITLTFNKAVADTTVAKITVKKGNATPTQTAKWADDKKSVVLAMDSKLTKGTYDVTVSGLEKEDLTASVTVEDQKLTAFELLSTNLVADTLPASFGTIKFKGVDQYGKFMKAGDVTVTSSFGTLYSKPVDNDSNKAPNSKVNAKDDPTAVYFKLTSALAILGTKGTITIVGENGVNLTSEITLVSPAQAAKVECLGLYNTDKAKYMDMTAGDKPANYVIALKFTDQYGTELKPEEAKNIQATVAGGTTNVDFNKSETVKIDDKDVYALRLKAASASDAEAKAGTMQVTLVNTQYGLLDNLSFTVAPGTVIKSFSVSADNDIYAGEDNTLSYTAIDADGNEVTKYDVLKKAFGTDKVAANTTLKKQADGSAKLVYNVSEVTNVDNKKYKGCDTVTLNMLLYKDSANVIVCNPTFKVNQKRILCEVTGIDSSKATAVVESGTLKFKATDLKIADQYGNTLTKDQIKAVLKTNSVKVKFEENKNDKWNLSGDTTLTDPDKEAVVTPAKLKDEVYTAKVNFKAADMGDYKDDGYTVTLSVEDGSKASDFAIEWKNDGLNVFSVSDGALDLKADDQFQVVGKVSGKKVVIDSSQYAIVSGSHQDQVAVEKGKDRIKKEATLTVVVDDESHKSNTITATYTYSNENPKLTKMSVKSDDKIMAVKKDSVMNINAFVMAVFDLKDQYGKVLTSLPSELTATVSVTGGEGIVKYSGTNKAVVEIAKDDKGNDKAISEITVTLNFGDLTVTKAITVE